MLSSHYWFKFRSFRLTIIEDISSHLFIFCPTIPLYSFHHWISLNDANFTMNFEIVDRFRIKTIDVKLIFSLLHSYDYFVYQLPMIIEIFFSSRPILLRNIPLFSTVIHSIKYPEVSIIALITSNDESLDFLNLFLIICLICILLLICKINMLKTAVRSICCINLS